MKTATFKPGSIVRDITTGHPYLVVQRLTNTIMVVDAHSHDRLNSLRAILARDFDQYCDDLQLAHEHDKWERVTI